MTAKLATPFVAFSVVALLSGGPAFARAPQGGSAIRQAIIQQSIATIRAPASMCLPL